MKKLIKTAPMVMGVALILFACQPPCPDEEPTEKGLFEISANMGAYTETLTQYYTSWAAGDSAGVMEAINEDYISISQFLDRDTIDLAGSMEDLREMQATYKNDTFEIVAMSAFIASHWLEYL